MLVPIKFTPPELRKDNYVARQLKASDVYLDYMAVMSSIEAIHKIRGGKWPTSDLSFEDDLIDLSWHQREFEFKTSFAYTIMNLDETKCLGCIYFYPPRSGMSDAKGDGDSDVEISWWVTQKMFEQGFYEELSFDIKQWVEDKWPFKKIAYVNKILPDGFFK